MGRKNHNHSFCEDCTYFQEQEKSIGICHRFPPIFAGNNSPIDAHHWKFPMVLAHSLCGEFQAEKITAI